MSYIKPSTYQLGGARHQEQWSRDLGTCKRSSNPGNTIVKRNTICSNGQRRANIGFTFFFLVMECFFLFEFFEAFLVWAS